MRLGSHRYKPSDTKANIEATKAPKSGKAPNSLGAIGLAQIAIDGAIKVQVEK